MSTVRNSTDNIVSNFGHIGICTYTCSITLAFLNSIKHCCYATLTIFQVFFGAKLRQQNNIQENNIQGPCRFIQQELIFQAGLKGN